MGLSESKPQEMDSHMFDLFISTKNKRDVACADVFNSKYISKQEEKDQCLLMEQNLATIYKISMQNPSNRDLIKNYPYMKC